MKFIFTDRVVVLMICLFNVWGLLLRIAYFQLNISALAGVNLTPEELLLCNELAILLLSVVILLENALHGVYHVFFYFNTFISICNTLYIAESIYGLWMYQALPFIMNIHLYILQSICVWTAMAYLFYNPIQVRLRNTANVFYNEGIGPVLQEIY